MMGLHSCGSIFPCASCLLFSSFADARRARTTTTPRAQTSELSAVLRRTERIAHRDLDNTDRDQLARISAYRLGAPAWRRGLLRPDPDASTLARRWRTRRSARPAPHPGDHAGAVDAAIVGARAARVARDHYRR